MLKFNYEKILFLDMDGVLNSNFLIRRYIHNCEMHGMTDDEIRNKYFKEFDHCTELIFPELAKNLNKICDETNCYIVWSSSWRRLSKYKNIENAQQMFNKRNLPGFRLISYTPQRMSAISRACNIKDWIETYGKKVKKFAILDDRTDAKYNTKRCHYFQTSVEDGLTEKIANNVINWLNS